MKHLRHNSRRAYAVVVVLSVITMMTFYFAAAHTSILTQASQSRVQIDRLKRIEAAGSALETARATPEGSLDLTLKPSDEPAGKAQWRPLAAEDPLWSTLPGITPRPGDRLLTIDWGGPSSIAQERFLFNPARAGAVRLAPVKP